MRKIIALLFLNFPISVWAEDHRDLKASAYKLENEVRESLFPFHNPFTNVFDDEKADRLFNRMLKTKSEDGTYQSSSLAKIRDRLVSKEQGFDENFVIQLLSELKSKLPREKPRIEKQADYFTAIYLQDYIERYSVESANPGDDGHADESVDEPKFEQANEKEKQHDPELPPDMPDRYNPFTKDLDQGQSEEGGQDKFVFEEANVAVPFFRQKTFGAISRKGPYKFTIGQYQRSNSHTFGQGSSKSTLTVNTVGKKQFSLFIPSGYAPLQPRDNRIAVTRKDGDIFEVSLSETIKTIEIPIELASRESLSPVDRDIYTRPVGFGQEEWPTSIRSAVFSQFDPKKDYHQQGLQVAEVIAKHIRQNYLYSTVARPETDLIDALNAGSFQCRPSKNRPLLAHSPDSFWG